jgi:hypothetical protein
MTEDEIFEDILLYRLPEDQKKLLMATNEDDLIMFHHTFGQWLRNNYGLWAPDNPHVVHTDGHHDNFPDQISQRIIERLWTHLTGKKRTWELVVTEVGEKEAAGVTMYHDGKPSTYYKVEKVRIDE